MRIRYLWRHRPRQGLLLFFDVKVIPVKAYGGRRYTREKRLILPQAQKTKGKFYLFTLYEVNTGRIRWAFMPAKDAQHVGRFMQRLRRWYPHQPVRVILDQDRAHPGTSRHTRAVMRTLKLHWLSLPKRSPDDNPVERLFSDIQVMILNNSNDPDPHTAQRRISAYFQRRNRRKNRRIRIAFLPDSHKID